MASKKKTELTYSQATERLDEILEGIERGSSDIDVLSEQVEEAAALIKICRDKLGDTEAKVEKIVDELAAKEIVEDDQEA